MVSEEEVERQQGSFMKERRWCRKTGATTCYTAVETVSVSHGVDFWLSLGLWGYVCTAALLLMTLAGKWILVQRYRPGTHPLFSSFVWRTELVEHLETDVALPVVLGACLGTPFISLWFQLMGAKIGPRAFINTIFLVEPDLITVGRGACINRGVTIQTHLFEDRVMKLDKLKLENSATVGCDSIVLYGAVLHANASLGPQSLCMKGEKLLSGRHLGCPALQIS